MNMKQRLRNLILFILINLVNILADQRQLATLLDWIEKKANSLSFVARLLSQNNIFTLCQLQNKNSILYFCGEEQRDYPNQRNRKFYKKSKQGVGLKYFLEDNMIVENDEFSEENSIIESTTIKTIRNLKSRKSYTNILSSRDDYPNSNDNTSIPPQTPSQHEDDNSYKTEQQARHKKVQSMPGTVGKNPMRKSTHKINGQHLKSESAIDGGETNQQREENAYEQDQMNPLYYGEARSMKAIQNGKQVRGVSNHLSKNNTRGQSSLTNYIGSSASEIPQQKEYITIDMEYAIQFVLTKSKALKDKIETESIHQAFITSNITKNKFFNISYNSFLTNLINHKVLTQDFKNVSKKMFEKLEKFFLDRLQKCHENVTIQQTYVKQSKSINSTLDKRIQELKKEIAQKNKIEF